MTSSIVGASFRGTPVSSTILGDTPRSTPAAVWNNVCVDGADPGGRGGYSTASTSSLSFSLADLKAALATLREQMREDVKQELHHVMQELPPFTGHVPTMQSVFSSERKRSDENVGPGASVNAMSRLEQKLKGRGRRHSIALDELRVEDVDSPGPAIPIDSRPTDRKKRISLAFGRKNSAENLNDPSSGKMPNAGKLLASNKSETVPKAVHSEIEPFPPSQRGAPDGDVVRTHSAQEREKHQRFRGMKAFGVMKELQEQQHIASIFNSDFSVKKNEIARTQSGSLVTGSSGADVSEPNLQSPANRQAWLPNSPSSLEYAANPSAVGTCDSSRRFAYDSESPMGLNRFENFVRSAYFDYFSGVMVLLNAVSLGAQTDWQARHVTSDSPRHYRLLEIFFCFVFTAELCVRLGVYRRTFFSKADFYWNIFDCVLVGMLLVEEYLNLQLMASGSDTADTSNLSILRLLRILRLVRVMRLVRVLRLIGELRTLVMSILGSLKSLVWAIVLLFVLMYVVGIYLTQLVLDTRLELGKDDVLGSPNDISDTLVFYFGSIGDTTYALYCAVTGGVDWSALVDPLRAEVSVFITPCFIFYIAFAVLCMLNVITGVFVESALLTAKKDKDSYMVSHMRSLFKKLDKTGARSITWEDFQNALGTNDMKEIFEHIDIDISEAPGIFQLLDENDSGTIEAEEFIAGCSHLQGPAKSLDLTLLIRELGAFTDRYYSHTASMETTVNWMANALARLLSSKSSNSGLVSEGLGPPWKHNASNASQNSLKGAAISTNQIVLTAVENE